MHTIIHPHKATTSRTATSAREQFRNPNYDCREHADAIKVVVYVPGVEAAGIEITIQGSDLTVTARKSHFVRVNWQALHLESAQRDYQLRLRLGSGFDYERLEAEIADGVLTVTLPKSISEFGSHALAHKRVA
jgi:HSP20 family protein